MKKIKIMTVLPMLLALLGSTPALAAGELVPVGQAVGIRLECDGVIVSGLAEIPAGDGAVCPAREAGVRPGDRITAVNGTAVRSGEEFLDAAKRFTGEPVTLRVIRAEQPLEIRVTPRRGQQGLWQLGLWLRDGVRGIGTVTFWDPATGAFGALGHGVGQPEGEGLLPLAGGEIVSTEITGVIPGRRGEPGELCGLPDGEELLGAVEENTPRGIFGTARTPMSGRQPMPVAADSEIRTGRAVIVSTVDDAGPREFEVEILRLEDVGGERQLTIAVTDPALLEVTGGIVQGMSGSPILQNGKLVGAVTHVLVSDPSKGYGISMENMLRSFGVWEEAA